MEDLRLEIRPAGRAKMDLIIRDTNGSILLSDQANLASIEGRKKVSKELSRKLQDRGIERTPPQLEEVLESAWNQHLQTRERQEAEAAAAAAQGGEEDTDTRELRRLDKMPADVRNEAEVMLRDPRLVERIVGDVEAQGVAGERELVVTLYLVGTSRKLTWPLATRVKGPTSSGKSYLINKVARLMPPESVIFATQMTPQALFHMKPNSLRHKFIVAGERSRKEDDDSEPAGRFHERLREWFGSQEFTTKDARVKEKTSRSSVYGWIGELFRVGAIEQVQAARGSMPATWRVGVEDVRETMGNVLPAEEDVVGSGA